MKKDKGGGGEKETWSQEDAPSDRVSCNAQSRGEENLEDLDSQDLERRKQTRTKCLVGTESHTRPWGGSGGLPTC